MLGLRLDTRETLHVLCLGAHCDDIEIGCGGTILRLARDLETVSVEWIVFSSTPQREEEARASAALFLDRVAESRIEVRRFRDGFFPYIGMEIKEYFETLKDKYNPDLIFTHYRDDRHQDHRVISDLTWNTFRHHLILEYEIPKYDGDSGNPNLFVPLDEDVCLRKARDLVASYPSQTSKRWFTTDAFLSIMRLRGIESNALTKYAEAFYCRKAVL